MRTTLTIPNEYYDKIKTVYREQGYQTINALMLDLIRKHFGKPHQSNAKMTVVEGGKEKTQYELRQALNPPIKVKKPKKDHSKYMCEHGTPAYLCKHDKCRKKVYANS